MNKTVSEAYLMGLTDGRRNLRFIQSTDPDASIVAAAKQELALCERIKLCAYSGTPANAEYLRGLSDFWANQARKPY